VEEHNDATGMRGAKVKLREGEDLWFGGDDHEHEVEHGRSSPR
jgi:hypothetical protein